MTIRFKAVNNKSEMIEVYTDGGCRSSATKKGEKIGPNDSSAWAAFLISGGRDKLIGEAEQGRTNNYMELKAVIEALKAILITNKVVIVRSDSKYVVDSINKKWMEGWKKRDWKKSDNSVPANVELWKELDEQISRFPFIEIKHVKGHNGDTYNELVDKHVNDLMDELEKNGIIIVEETEPLTFDQVHLDWVAKDIKDRERAEIILQEAYDFLTSENFHAAVEAIEMLTGIKYD